MNQLQSVCVFCGSSAGGDPRYAEAAQSLGRMLAEQRIRIVYGGGQVGLMGVLADAALAAGGEVVGVIPEGLATRELIHPRATRMHVVRTMHERKALMADLSDAFVALPGGFGTFEELFEVITWAQLGIHQKPIGLLNAAGYFDPLVSMLEAGVSSGFIRRPHLDLVLVRDAPQELREALLTHEPPATRAWITKDEA